MRTIVGALIFAAASAQKTTTNSKSTTDSINKAVSDVTNWLLGKTKENLSTGSDKKEFPLYAQTATTMGLKFTFALDNTALGVNFVSADLYLSGPAANWANGTAQLVYFQIEQPVEAKPAARLLQAASNSTAKSNAAPVTGTGNWEGWSGSIVQPWTTARALRTNKNSWGKRSFKTDTTVYTSFGGADAVNTTSSSAW